MLPYDNTYQIVRVHSFNLGGRHFSVKCRYLHYSKRVRSNTDKTISTHKTSADADWGILQRRHLLRAGLTNWRGNKFRLWRKPLLKWEDSVFGWRCLRKDRHNVRKGRPISKLELTELIISTWLLVIRLKFCSLPDLGVSAYAVVIRG